MRKVTYNGAAALFREASHREPDIPEDRSLLIAALEKAGKKEEADQERNAATETFGPNGLPTTHVDARSDSLTHFERVKTELDPETLRFEMESTLAQATTSGASGSRRHSSFALATCEAGTFRRPPGRSGERIPVRIGADKGNAAAHLGLAEIARRQNKLDQAVSELQSSLQTRDSAVVRTTLARVYLEQKKTVLARAEAERALKLAPNYAEAKQLLEHLPRRKIR